MSSREFLKNLASVSQGRAVVFIGSPPAGMNMLELIDKAKEMGVELVHSVGEVDLDNKSILTIKDLEADWERVSPKKLVIEDFSKHRVEQDFVHKSKYHK